MGYEPKNGQVTLWKNDKYTTGGNQPYAKGKGLDLNGNEFEYTLWIPKSDKIKGFNMSISEPYVKPTSDNIPQPQTNAEPFPTRNDETDLPF